MSRAPPICSTNYKSDVSRQMITDIEQDVISGHSSALSLSPRVNSIESHRDIRTMRIDEPRIPKYYFSSTRPCRDLIFFNSVSSVFTRFKTKRRKKILEIVGRLFIVRGSIDRAVMRQEAELEWNESGRSRYIVSLKIYRFTRIE